MAITVSLLGTPTFSTASGTKTVTATPAVGDLIVIITAHTGNTSTTAPTDNNAGGGGTYTIVNTAVKATSADTMKVWVRDSLITSATSTVFTHAPGTSTGGGLVVIDCQGGDKAGSAAIVKSAIQSNQAAGGTPAPVFASAVNTQNAVIGAVFNASNPAALTPRTNFTELYDSGYNTPATGLEVMSDNSGETGTTMTWGGTSASAYASVVVELEASVTHDNTGTLTGQIGSVSGSANRQTPAVTHATTGVLVGQDSSVAGSSTRFRALSTSGTLTGQGSTVNGSATRFRVLSTNGSLTGQDAIIVGSSTRYRQFGSSGTLDGQESSITGNADSSRPHPSTGALTGQIGSSVGSAQRFRTYDTSGTLTGQLSLINGNAQLNIPHSTSGTLTGQGSVISGSTFRFRAFGSTGGLTGPGSSITGAAVKTDPVLNGLANLSNSSSISISYIWIQNYSGFRDTEDDNQRVTEADEFRVTEGFFWDGPRVTEASDPRITEADVFRVTEKFIEGESSFTGSGSLSIVGQATLKGYWDNGGEAFFNVTPLKRMYGIVPLNGTGTLTNDGVLTMPASSSFTGTASISFDPIVAKFGFGAFNATGSLNVIPSLTLNGVSDLQTTGTHLFASIGMFIGHTHNFNGVASISAVGDIVAYRSSSLNATGSISPLQTFTATGSSAVNATGTLSSSGTRIRYGLVNLSGTGSLAAIPVPKFFATFSKIGTGTLAADGTETDFSSTMYYRTAGVWKETIPYVKRGGTWSTPVAVYKNISGSWKRVY